MPYKIHIPKNILIGLSPIRPLFFYFPERVSASFKSFRFLFSKRKLKLRDAGDGGDLETHVGVFYSLFGDGDAALDELVAGGFVGEGRDVVLLGEMGEDEGFSPVLDEVRKQYRARLVGEVAVIAENTALERGGIASVF